MKRPPGWVEPSTPSRPFLSKWPHKDFKDYLVRQIGKSGVKVHLNTTADAAMIRKEDYDVVSRLWAQTRLFLKFPGSREECGFGPEVYGNEDALAKDVVVIGGG